MNFKYTIDITADPEEVFTALTNPFQIELWSGYPAEMKAEEGFVFSLWEGDICGVNLEVKPNHLLVQEWFFGETDQRSIVTIKLKKDGPRTRVELEHTNIPDEVFEVGKSITWALLRAYWKCTNSESVKIRIIFLILGINFATEIIH